jgi:nucleoside-diphosphate-sugar epimerase
MPEGGALVTGAAGFLGLAVVRSLSRAGVSVVAVDRAPSPDVAWRDGTVLDRVRYERRDVSHAPLDDLLRGTEGVVHAAALTPADEHVGDTADRLLEVNLGSLAPVLAALRRSRSARRLVLVSSAGVYDQDQDRTLGEDDATGGASLYGAAKLAAEIVGRRYAQLHGLGLCAVRPTSLFGGGEKERPSRPRVTPFLRLVESAAAGQPVRLERWGSRADWVSVDDAADAITTLLREGPLDGRSFNLSSARPRAFEEVAREVAGAVGLELDEGASTCVDGGPDRPAVISNERIREAIGWSPARSLAEAARELVAERRPSAVSAGGA